MQTLEVEPNCTFGSLSATAEDYRLPSDLLGRLRRMFSPAEVKEIAETLEEGELRVIRDLRDALIIARIARMSDAQLSRYSDLVPRDDQQWSFYSEIQVTWIQDEEFFMGTVLGRSPTHPELFKDFMKNKNGSRFRAYFAMKYPERMRNKNDPSPAHAK